MSRPGSGVTPRTEAAEGALLRTLRACSYQGRVSRLAKLLGFEDEWMIGALVRLSGRQLVKVERLPFGDVAVNITTAGRQALGQPRPR